MLKQFKAFYNKADSNYLSGHVDPFEFHKTFYFVLRAFKVTDNGQKLKSTLCDQNTVIFITGLLAIILALISLIHGLNILDIPYITESGTYFVVLFYELLILSCTKLNLPQYQNFLKAMKEDFNYICTKGEKYRARYFENQMKTWKICILACIFTAGIAIGMNIFATLVLLYFLVTDTGEDGGHRPYLFPLWLYDVDISASPLYETLFVYSIVCVFLYAHNYIFMIQTQIVWVRHIASKADIVIWSIQDLLLDIYPSTTAEEKKYFSDLLQYRLRDIVIHHQSMYSLLDDYAHVYKKLLLYEQKCCGPVICLTAYCSMQKLDEGEVNAILILLFFATIVLYFIPSVLCNFLAIKIKSVCDTCWDISFWNAGPVIRPYMVLIMQRSLRPLPLCAAGFEEISIQTFSRKMTSAYSLFNMLRQANL